MASKKAVNRSKRLIDLWVDMPLNFDEEIVDKLIQQNDFVGLTDYLRETFIFQKPELSWLPIWHQFSPDAVDKLISVFRKEEFYADINHLITTSTVDLSSSLPDILRFLYKSIVSNELARDKIYPKYFGILFKLLESRKCLNKTCCVLYKLLKMHSVFINNIGLSVYNKVLVNFNDIQQFEWLCELVIFFVSRDEFWSYYKDCILKSRISLLNTLNALDEVMYTLPDCALNVLARQFIDKSNLIFHTEPRKDSYLAICEVALIINIITEACYETRIRKCLQQNKELLEHVGALLINVQRLGKNFGSDFSDLQRQLEHPSCPFFTVRVNLLRFIAYVCKQNAVNQDLVREAKLIPVILKVWLYRFADDASRDSVIEALRSLCDNNIKNQELVACMYMQGIGNFNILEEIGLKVRIQGGNCFKIVS